MATSTTITQPALRITTKVLPGNKIQIQLPLDSVVGEEVDVLVMRSPFAALRVLRSRSLRERSHPRLKIPILIS